MQLKKILLPYDGSKHSANAAAYAVHLAKADDAKITLVHCYSNYAELAEAPELFIGQMEETLKRSAEACMAEGARILDETGVSYETLLKEGSPGNVITDLAKSREYDLVVMGSVGHTNIGGLFLGSVSHKVISTMYCPVLIVP